MKSNRKVLIVALFVLMMISLTFVLSSCYSASYKGIKETYINSDGELVIVYTNGEKENLGVVAGKDGEDGKDGANGVDGEDGKDGQGSQGNITITGGQNISLATSKATRSAVSVVAYYNDRFSQYASSGSGVIYKYEKTTDGYFIITNYHVVYDADNGISNEIYVMLYGNEYSDGFITAEYIGGSLNYDIAVLYIKNDDIIKNSSAVCVDVANSNEVCIGDTAIAVGNARGEGISATTGVISVDSESLEMTGADENTPVTFRVMRTDASVNPGNSGGGLYNEKGELIGIVNAKIIVDGVEGIGYAIPSVVAINVADNIIDNCFKQSNTYVKRALLGITISVSESKSIYNTETGKISIVETVYVVEASSKSLLADSIKANDVIVSIQLEGHEKLVVTRQFHVIDYLLQARVGDTGTLVVLRDGEEISLDFTISSTCIANY